jgi:hypothetical protein
MCCIVQPEIFIPLKHLTTTLEILGNIFVVRGDFEDARGCLERACPLMELLPVSLLEHNDRDHNRVVDNNENINSNLASNSNYANECFELLRKVYAQLYGDVETVDDLQSEQLAPSLSSLTKGLIDKAVDIDIDDYGDNIDDSRTHTQNFGLFDIEGHIEHLRSPYQHLREELVLIHSDEDVTERDDDLYLDAERVGEQSLYTSPFTSSLQAVPGSRRTLMDILDNIDDTQSRRMAEVEYDDEPLVVRLGGTTAATVSANLETLMMRFVRAELEQDKDMQKEVAKLAESYSVDLILHDHEVR